MKDYRPLISNIVYAVLRAEQRPKWTDYVSRHVKPDNFFPYYPANVLLAKGYRPRNTHQLALEFPVFDEKSGSTKYIASERALETFWVKTTDTRTGKYLRRHFDAPDHVIRDAVELAVNGSTCHVTYDMKKMLELVANPNIYSCMTNFEQDSPDHPYRVYDPELGWGMAYRMQAGVPVSRALIYKNPIGVDAPCFVRSYQGPKAQTHKPGDSALEAWLVDKGYTFADDWPIGAELRHITARSSTFLAPYIDGSNDFVQVTGSTLKIVEYKKLDEIYKLEGLQGYKKYDAYHHKFKWTCPHCETEHDVGAEGESPEEMRHHGRHDSAQHCTECDDEFTFVIGYSGREYYLHNDDVVHARNGKAYDEDYLGYNDIVEITAGRYSSEYEEAYNTVRCTDGGTWAEEDIVASVNFIAYADDDDRIVELEAGDYRGEWTKCSNAFQCAHTCDIYHEDDGYTTVEKDGETLTVADENLDDWKEENAEDEETNEEETCASD